MLDARKERFNEEAWATATAFFFKNGTLSDLLNVGLSV
jgi:hypothetical protein